MIGDHPEHAEHLTEHTGVPVSCYHGGLARGARDRMVEQFQNGEGPGALVLSLKAGGTGLNLTAASHVVLYDRWWNPAVEDQARDGAGDPRAALRITSAVRDRRYQALLLERNAEATPDYSLHTTGWAFDIDRTYVSRRQALAFQNVLDRLAVLGGITWVREPDAIHVTVSSEAKTLLPLLDRIGAKP